MPNAKGRRRRFGSVRKLPSGRFQARYRGPDGLMRTADTHTGNTLAATGGATTRELMHRMGHSSVRAALVHQHLVNGRDHQIADYVDGQIKKVERPPHGPSGT